MYIFLDKEVPLNSVSHPDSRSRLMEICAVRVLLLLFYYKFLLTFVLRVDDYWTACANNVRHFFISLMLLYALKTLQSI